MTELKTLKDLEWNENGESNWKDMFCRPEELRSEAIKWVKKLYQIEDEYCYCLDCDKEDNKGECQSNGHWTLVKKDEGSSHRDIISFINKFFNLTDEDLKIKD